MSKLVIFLVLLAAYAGITLAENASEILLNATKHFEQIIDNNGYPVDGGLTTPHTQHGKKQ